MKYKREFFIPKGATEADNDGTDAVIYTYEKNGFPCAVGFHGRAQKPDWRYRFQTVGHREKHIAEFIEERRFYMVLVSDTHAVIDRWRSEGAEFAPYRRRPRRSKLPT